MQRHAFFWLLLTALIAIGCGTASTVPETKPPASRKPGNKRAQPIAEALAWSPGLQAARLGAQAGALGPYLARGGTSDVAVWVADREEAGRAWFSQALDRSGHPVAEPAQLVPARVEVDLVAVRPRAGGFAVVSTSRRNGVEVLLLDERGRLAAGPELIASPSEQVYWVQALAVETNVHVVWAQRRGDRADLHVAVVSPAGAVSKPRVALRDAKAWQAKSNGERAALAAVQAQVGPSHRGPVALVTLDAEGNLLGAPTQVQPKAIARYDLDMVPLGERFLLSWSQLSGGEARVATAVCEATGKLLSGPLLAAPPLGDQQLVQLVEGSRSHGFLVWRDVADETPHTRRLQIAKLSEKGQVGERRTGLEVARSESASFEIASREGGLAIVAEVPDCPEAERCAQTQLAYFELDAQLQLAGGAPLELEQGEPEPAWGLECAAGNCVVLGVVELDEGPRAHAIALSGHPEWAADALSEIGPTQLPFPVASYVVSETEPLAGVDVVPVSDQRLFAAWVSYFDPAEPYERRRTPAPDGRYAPVRALLQTQLLASAEGKAAAESKPYRVSLRARSLGGVSLAPHDGDVLLAWSAIDNGSPQLFGTIFNRKGQQRLQRMLTRRSREVSGVVAIASHDGWIIAWTDERDGDPEIYMARVNRGLRMVGTERRLTRAEGASMGAQLAQLGSHALAVWSDARSPEQPGYGNIYMQRFELGTLSPAAEAAPLMKTSLHSYAPVIDIDEEGAWLAWLETDPASKARARQGGVYIGRLDTDGKFVSPPQLLRVSSGTPTGLALGCEPTWCRIAMTVDAAGTAELHGAVFEAQGNQVSRRLISLQGPPQQLADPAIVGDQIFYAERVADDRGQLRRLQVRWRN